MTFDLDAFIDEATGTAKPYEFTFDGAKYVLPAELDLRVAAMLSRGDLAGSLELLLGAEQWARMCAAKKVFDSRALIGLLSDYAAHTGSSMGESRASRRSSKSTARPSKPTSKGTTKLR